MARLRERIFLGVVAVTFLLTTVGGTGFIIWEVMQDNKNASQQAELEKALQDAQNNKNTSKGKKMDGFTPLTDKVSDLQITELTAGTGAEAKADSTVTVDYTGAVAATGEVFESSLDSGQQATFSLAGNLIAGWKEGVPGMKEGGKRRLVIPAAKAYGSNPPAGSGIPADADLVFDIILHKVQ